MPTVNDPNGKPLRIADDGYALTFATTIPLEAHAGDLGDCYTVIIEVDTGTAACDFFYLKNTSNKTLRIYRIKAKTHTADTEIQIKTSVTGNPNGGSELLPINALIGDGSLADVDCQYRVSGDLDLIGDNIFDKLFLDQAFLGEQNYPYTGDIALLKNQALVFHAPSDTGGNVNLTVYFDFHDRIE